MSGRRVVVTGCLNLDTFHAVARLPERGETVVAHALAYAVGGKAANQAAAAARAGADSLLLAAAGADAEEAIRALTSYGVDTSQVVMVEGPTGSAQVLVEQGSADNLIVVQLGANEQLQQVVDGFVPRRGDVVVAQFEAAPELVAPLFERAHAMGARTVLNAAPARLEHGRAVELADVLVVNEAELAVLAGASREPALACGRRVPGGAVSDPDEADPKTAARRLAARYDTAVVVTLGAAGAVVVERDAVTTIAAPEVEAVDSTGAGDCLVGWLAARLAEGAELPDATRQAVLAASLSTRCKGAAPSYPSRTEVREWPRRL